MSTQVVGSSSAAAPLNFTGLASGLNTNEVVTALVAVERRPVTQLSNEQTTLQAEQTQLRTIQSSLQSLAFSAADLGSPSLFETTQTVTSSNPSQVAALTTTGAAIGAYEVGITQLASSAQRTFTFTTPASADTLTIDGQEFTVKAGESAQEFANAINTSSTASVYAAPLEGGSIVLSSRTTGQLAEGFIAVSDAGGTLVEQAALAKNGRNAEYTIDGVPGSSSSNTVKSAIPGVTLTLAAVTTTTGPATIDVGAPAPNVSSIQGQVDSFVKLYNSTISAIHTQLTTKPPEDAQTAGELGTGTLFGDSDLSGLLNSMREAIYTPIEGLPAGMASLTDVGVSTGAASGSAAPAQGAIEGELQIDTASLTKAIETNPSGVETMLERWSQGFQKLVNVDAEPGGTLETRIEGDTTRISDLEENITTMNEMIAVREKSLKAQFTAMETAMSESQAESSWLAGQISSLTSTSTSTAASSLL